MTEALLRAGFPLRLYCQGRGVCGQCSVRIVAGRLPEETQAEKKWNNRKKIPPDWCLACQLRVVRPLEVELPPTLLIQKESLPEPRLVRKKAADFPDYDPLVKKYLINMSDLAFETIERSDEAPESETVFLPGFGKMRINPEAREKLASLSPKYKQIMAVIYDDQLVLDFEVRGTVSRTFGLAIDLGTTTISAEIINLVTGEILAYGQKANLQAVFGADLVSRISYAGFQPDNLAKLREAALKSVNELVISLMKKAGVSRKRIYAVSLAANPVMNHLFLGVPVESFGRSPFQSEFISHSPVSAAEAGLKINPRAMVYLCPNLISFVGGDVASGLIYAGLVEKSGCYLYLDLGTNGEIVLKKGETILVTSTAAGPAFEGSGISCGLPAVTGAIEEAYWQKGKFRYRTIGRTRAAGICGSGLVAVLAEAIKAGLLDKSGKITEAKSAIKITRKVILTQEDIRKLQLAMAAIKSGLNLLLKSSGLKWSELDGLYLAGVFGNSLNINQCLSLGLLPPLPREKIFFIGNASVKGARLALMSRKARRKLEDLPRQIEFVSLAGREDFQTEFFKALTLSRQYWGERDV